MPFKLASLLYNTSNKELYIVQTLTNTYIRLQSLSSDNTIYGDLYTFKWEYIYSGKMNVLSY